MTADELVADFKKRHRKHHYGNSASPIEEATLFRRLTTGHGLSKRDIALLYFGKREKFNKVVDRMKLLEMSIEDQEKVHEGKMTVVEALKKIKKR